MQVALTGGMGSGKTFVLSCFRDFGWNVVECDAIARDLLEHDPEVACSVRGTFGGSVFRKDGSIDRKALAAVVFADSDKLRILEEILHPLIHREWMGILNNCPDKPGIVEIPLLFEKNLEKLFKVSVCVTVSGPTQIERLARRGFTEAEARARIARQMPLDKKELRADYVILNNGNPDYTRAQVARLTTLLVSGD
jgi:dephospho-CoA kinase